MSRVLLTVLVVMAGTAAATSSAAAQARRGKPQPAGATVTASVTFTAGERDVIVKYYAAHPYAAKPLPPGIAKNLARGKPLPPGIAKRALPAALLAQLPRRGGFEITVFGDRIVMLQTGGVVVDVLVNVFH